jgi:glycosyltransferase involved in cell wall biosynthesis
MKKNIITIDCERMKYPFTGLYEFCFQLSSAVYQKKEMVNGSLSFYTPLQSIGFLSEQAKYLKQQSYHKFFNPYYSKCHIWHTTYQGSMYFPTSSKIKKILTIHDLNFLYDDQKKPSKIKKYLNTLQQKINRADIITVISNFTKSELLKHLDTKGKPIETIYNGCHTRNESQTFEKPSFLDPGKQFLFTVGTIARKKNFHVLPAILKNNEFNLVISGVIQDAAYVEQILAEARKHQVADRVIISGPITEGEKSWLYKNAHAFLFPSIAEGFGIPVVEAMSYGTPVIVSNYTALPEIAGEDGYYFCSFDPDEMRETFSYALNDFYNNPVKKQSLISRSQTFDWGEAAQKYIRLYNQLL